MNPAAEESAVPIYLCFQYQREAGWAHELEFPVGGEVAQGIGDQAVAVDFHSAYDVGPVTDEQVCPGVYHRVREAAQVAAIFTEIGFRPLRHMLVRGPFRAAVKGDDDNIVFGRESPDQPPCVFDVQKIVRGRIGGEGYDGDAPALNIQGRYVADLARVCDAEVVEPAHGAFASFGAEVVSMIVGEAHYVEAGIFEMFAVARRDAKGEAARRARRALGGRAAFEHRAFQISESDVGGRENRLNLCKHGRAIIRRQRA